MMAHPVDTFGYGFTRFFHPRWLIKDVKFQAIVEPEPDPESRVTLTASKDTLGMNRVCLDWRIGPRVQRTFDRTFALLAEEFQSSGIATVKLDPPIEGGEWPSSLVTEGSWHHMGTTRMHDSPKSGVVDRNGLVHGMSNLYIAGSSVFPTAGANFPTITICALTLRLSEHIVLQLRNPNVPLPIAAPHDVAPAPEEERLSYAETAQSRSPTFLRSQIPDI
ncbi:MAG: hypothetical protein A3K04_06880 [Gallionellales bacterium RBG_16_56_9]|nr:MAG: hypothetical protein A3K04_06880 [Gallionellales bacterium RBG_16_56_9]